MPSLWFSASLLEKLVKIWSGKKQNKPSPCSYHRVRLTEFLLHKQGPQMCNNSGVFDVSSLPAAPVRARPTFGHRREMNLFPKHYWLILPRCRDHNETFAEFNRKLAPPPASILAVSLNFPAPPSQCQINKAQTLQRADDLFWSIPLGKGRKAACWSWLLPFCLKCTQTFSPSAIPDWNK